MKEHGEKVLELLANDWFEAIKEGKNEPSSFVISPFSAVQKQVKRILKQQLPTRIDIERTKLINGSINPLVLFILFKVKRLKRCIL